jgi:hypothetical protein
MFDQKIQQLERFIGQTDTQTIVTENAQHGIELERAKSEDHRRNQLPRFRAYFHATRWLKPSYSHHTPIILSSIQLLPGTRRNWNYQHHPTKTGKTGSWTVRPLTIVADCN